MSTCNCTGACRNGGVCPGAGALISDYEAVLADKRRLVRELDVAMHGEDGAAKQASLCDLIGPARQLRIDAERYRWIARQFDESSGGWILHLMIWGAPSLESLDEAIDAARKVNP